MSMTVTPIAHTVFNAVPETLDETKFVKRWADSDEADVDELHEFAGRACYQAWECKNPETAENAGYLANILKQGHESVLEHGSVTFYVEGVSRSLTHELIRHRHLSFSELSQRYVDVGDHETVLPPLFRGDKEAERIITVHNTGSVEAYDALVDIAKDKGATRKEARQAARSVMPNVETKIVVTGNVRAWRDVLRKRWHTAADAEIREFAGHVLEHLRVLAPHSVQDIPDTPFG